MNNTELDIERAVNEATWHVNGKNVWGHRESLKDYMARTVELPEGLISDIAYPGGISTIAAPSGTGKSALIYSLAKEAASAGIFLNERLTKFRVLIVDYDNPRGIVQRRLKGVCESYDIDLQIMGREHSPQLLDEKAWKLFPAYEYDIIIIDSFGSATVGISEKEGAKLQQALNTLKTLADQELAVIVLENTDKTGAAYRGRGEKVERVDIFYEVRDITDWTPPQSACWWQKLPSGDDAAWQDRAARKSERNHIDLAFVCRKFRWGEEPAPFALKIDFSTKPWSVSDITERVEQMGKEASQAAKDEKQKLLLNATIALTNKLKELQKSGDKPMSKTDAVSFLRAQGLKRDEARNVLGAYDADVYPTEGRWRLCETPGSRGKRVEVHIA